MSLFALLSTAVAIPLGVACVTFVFFYLRARSADRKRARYEQRKNERQAVREAALNGRPTPDAVTLSPVTLTETAPEEEPVPAFRPLSYYLDTAAVAVQEAHPISELPGLDPGLQRALNQLGYTSIEQVARWGRADVRAVSAMLGIDQRLIEDGWVPSARQLLSTA